MTHEPRRTVTIGETMGLFFSPTALLLESHPPFHLSFGGAETNVAIGLTRLGNPTTWVGRLGDDGVGQFIERELHAEGVRTLRLAGPGHTGIMVRTQQGFDRLRVQYARSGSAGSCLTARDLPLDEIRSAPLLHITGITAALGEGPREALRLAVRTAKDAGVPVSLDLNYRAGLWSPADAHHELLALTRQSDIVFATADEARLLLGDSLDGSPTDLTADLTAAGEAASGDHDLASRITALGPTEVIVKNGADGALSLVRGEFFTQNVTRVKERDPVGAGDAFAAGYLHGVLNNMPLQERLDFAGRVAAHSVTVTGDWEGLPHPVDLAVNGQDILR